ncbi:hypothetical protein K9O30_06120 [Clostridium bowmanii]|uniref:hypothetical protein n=1 Tax=Clostridium bowmanii TaxID=132925 RepID=UPI001C0BCD31|nr:hypothetical protein [Clostridium bowmanii]MBU3188736.1 hypothetical protein [Clostridium bowmanii]MCA1073321.1 hypothetical protein [Clostridium bowmanii]
MDNRMINFKEWLQNKKGIANLYTIEGIVWYIESIANFALKFSISKTPLLEINVPKDFIDIIDKINKEKRYTFKCPNKTKYSKSLDFYIEYLKCTQSQQLIEPNISKQKNEIVGCNDRKALEIELDRISQSQEQKFLDYLKDIIGVSETIAESYVNTLKNISECFKVMNLSITPLLNITTTKDYKLIDNTIWLNKAFVNINKNANYQYGLVFNKYGLFLDYDKRKNQSYELNSVTQTDVCNEEEIDVNLKESVPIMEAVQGEQLVSSNDRNLEYTKETDDLLENSMINFKMWLYNKKEIVNSKTVNSISENIQIIASFALGFHILQTSLLKIKLPNDFIDAINKLNKSRNFIVKDNVAKNKYSKSIEFYLQYLKFVISQQLDEPNISKQSEKQVECNFRKMTCNELNLVTKTDDRTDEETDEETDESVLVIEPVQGEQIVNFHNPNQGYTKERDDILVNNMITFKVWLYNNKEIVSSQTISNIAEYVQSAADAALKFNISQTSILDMNLPKDFSYVIHKLNRNKTFVAIDNVSKKKYNEAIEFYLQYLKFIQFHQQNIPYKPKQLEDVVECNSRKVSDRDLDVIPESQKQKFLAYLEDIIFLSDTIAKSYIYALENIAKVCRIKNISNKPLLEITMIEDYNRIIDIMWLNKPFQNNNKNANYKYGLAINKYREFLSYCKFNDQSNELNQEHQIQDCTEVEIGMNLNESVSITESVKGEHIVNFNNQNQTYTHSHPYKLNIDDVSINVHNWTDVLVKLCEELIIMCPDSASEFPLNSIVNSAKWKCFSYDSLLLIAGKRLSNGLWIETNFSANNIVKTCKWLLDEYKISTENVNIYYALKGESPDIDIELQLLLKSSEIVIEEVEFYINQKQYNKKQKIYIETLDEYFPKGIRVSSSIQVNKFKKLAQQINSQILNCDNEMIIDELQTIAVRCEESFYMSPNKIVEEKVLLEKILSFVLDTFKTKKVIYFDGIFNRFKDELTYTNIYNQTVLKGLLEYYFEDCFCIQNSYISLSDEVIIDVQEEIEETVKNSDAPISKYDILKLLPHISKKKIIETLNYNNNILYWQINEYWHIERIDISEQEKNLIRDIIWYETRDGFISVKKLYEILKEKAAGFIESNCIINYVCLRDILKCYFAGEFGFKYTFIGKVGEEMSANFAMQKFIEGKEMFKLTELSNFVEENDLQAINSLFIEEASKLYIRTDEDNFLLKEKLNINIDLIKAIENATKKYLINGYVTLSSIDSFTIFPTIDLRWNIFLLQSIVEGYCNDLKIYSHSRSITKPIGVIVDNSFGFDSYDEILVEEIAIQDLKKHFSDEKEALKYLFNNGYLAQRRMVNFDRVFALAKFKNKQAINAL